MAVPEADGDSASYFNASSHISIQQSFESMSEVQLDRIIDEDAVWKSGLVPDHFDPFNSWGGAHSAKANAAINAVNAKAEQDRRLRVAQYGRRG